MSTRGPGRSSRIPAPSQRPGPRPGRGDGAGPDRGRVSVNKFPEGFPGCRVFGLPGQGSGLPSLENPPDEPEDSAVELDDLCTDIALLFERLDRDGETWDRSSGSSRKAEPTDEEHVSEAMKKIERLQAETNRQKDQVAKMSYGNNTSDKRKPTTPKFHDGTCQ